MGKILIFRREQLLKSVTTAWWLMILLHTGQWFLHHIGAKSHRNTMNIFVIKNKITYGRPEHIDKCTNQHIDTLDIISLRHHNPKLLMDDLVLTSADFYSFFQFFSVASFLESVVLIQCSITCSKVTHRCPSALYQHYCVKWQASVLFDIKGNSVRFKW